MSARRSFFVLAVKPSAKACSAKRIAAGSAPMLSPASTEAAVGAGRPGRPHDGRAGRCHGGVARRRPRARGHMEWPTRTDLSRCCRRAGRRPCRRGRAAVAGQRQLLRPRGPWPWGRGRIARTRGASDRGAVRDPCPANGRLSIHGFGFRRGEPPKGRARKATARRTGPMARRRDAAVPRPHSWRCRPPLRHRSSCCR